MNTASIPAARSTSICAGSSSMNLLRQNGLFIHAPSTRAMNIPIRKSSVKTRISIAPPLSRGIKPDRN
jgi:hypothetical protein